MSDPGRSRLMTSRVLEAMHSLQEERSFRLSSIHYSLLRDGVECTTDEIAAELRPALQDGELSMRTEDIYQIVPARTSSRPGSELSTSSQQSTSRGSNSQSSITGFYPRVPIMQQRRYKQPSTRQTRCQQPSTLREQLSTRRVIL